MDIEVNDITLKLIEKESLNYEIVYKIVLDTLNYYFFRNKNYLNDAKEIAKLICKNLKI